MVEKNYIDIDTWLDSIKQLILKKNLKSRNFSNQILFESFVIFFFKFCRTPKFEFLWKVNKNKNQL